jgi:hypothetical protein
MGNYLLNSRQTNYEIISDMEEPIKIPENYKCIAIIWLLVMYGITMIFNVTGLIVGVQHANATCYEEKLQISLSNWLIIACSFMIVTHFIKAILSIITIIFVNTYAIFIYFIVTVISSCFSLAMLIIAIVELQQQYPTCSKQVGSVCIMVIICVVLNLLNSVLACCTTHK